MACGCHNLNLEAPFYAFLRTSYIKSLNLLKKIRAQNIFGVSFYKNSRCIQNPQCRVTKSYLHLLDTVLTTVYDT